MRVQPGRSSTLGGNLRSISTGLPKTTGTIYALVQLRRPGDPDHGKYWDANAGGSWQAAGSVVSWPTATYSKGAWWTYAIPAAATTGKDEAVIKLVELTDNVAVPASQTVTASELESVTVEPITTLTGLGDLVESLRKHHMLSNAGQVFYVDPVNGDTIANGATGERWNPLSTVTEALSLTVDSSHTVIFLVAGNSGGVTTLNERVTINKRYTYIRGPGRDFLWKATATGDIITVTADGVELSGIQLQTHTVGVGRGIVVNGSDFAYINNVWLESTQGNAIHLLDANDCVIRKCHVHHCGISGAGHGIVIDPTGGSINHSHIVDCHVADVQGDGIRIGSGTVNDTEIVNCSIHDSTAWGINILGGNDAVVRNNVLGNNASGDINDGGTDTIDVNNSKWCPQPSGIREIVVSVEDQNTNPVTGFQIDIYDSSDATSLWVVNDDDNDGSVTFYIGDGTYKLRITAANFTADNMPETLVVAGDDTQTYTGTIYQVTAADAPLCTVWGYCYDAGGNARNDVELVFTGDIPVEVGNNIVTAHRVTIVPGSGDGWDDGYFEIDLLRGTTVRYTDPMAGHDDTDIIIPNAGSVALATLV